ncbi:MAG TPA: hypothetical protein VFY51_11395 [Pyrinomonadaceae bacterium]|nr:hypothetical protein [Pyrinomonadaceae bacterium]
MPDAARANFVIALIVLVFGWPATVAGQCSNPAAATAADALAAKFDAHQFVLIGSTHGDAKIEEFLMCLISRPAFKERVTDIVVESASSSLANQRFLDRYVLKLEEIAAEDLASIWLDTDYPKMWATLPQVRQFVAVLRDVNKTLPVSKRIRLVGGNEPTDWSKVKVTEDLGPYPFKTNFMQHLLIEHLAKTPGNKTLVVYGDAHIRLQGSTFMRAVEAAVGRAKLFIVGRIGELRADERAYLAAIGDPNKPFFVESRQFPNKIPWPPSLRVSFEERSDRLADYIDGLVYLGPEADRNLTGSIKLSAAQQRELDRRNAINSDPQRSMRARFQHREQWFRAHPNDFPSRP